MIRINCFYQAEEGRAEEALTAARELVAESLKQDGCVAYDVFQSGTRADVLFFCETWRDEAALAEHMKSEPFVKYGSMMKAVGKFTIEQFDLKK
ncbi:MAG: antibiotic biosynthesis monooxygenase [Thermoguttaceae bacterium]|nr:antibiotic biosynthesis monooxygenase [Thermoguttaceae bacterium]